MTSATVISLLLSVALLASTAAAMETMEKVAVCELNDKFLHVCAGCMPDPCATCQMPFKCSEDFHIHQLDLSNIELGELPDSFVRLRWAETLTLNNCSLQRLPYFFGVGLDALTTLYISNNQLVALPTTFGPSLKRITTFIADHNYLKTLDEERFPMLEPLQVLNLAKNRLLYLPGKFGRLVNLRQFNVSSNMLQQLPFTMTQMSSLEVLDASFNLLREFSVGNMVSLKYVDLHTNFIRALSDDIGNMANVTHLDLSNNELKVLPESFGQLTALTELNLDGNCLDCQAIQLNATFTPYIRARCLQWAQRKC